MRVRLRHTKIGKVRFLGHRDLARVLERGLRKADVPIRYTEGFSPRPKVHFGLALPTGHESIAEYVDIDLAEPLEQPDRAAGDPPDAAGAGAVDPASLPGRLTGALPEGIDVVAAAVVDRSEPSLQEAVTTCTWELDLPDVPAERAGAVVAQALAAESLLLDRTRKGRTSTDEVRPYIVDLAVVEPLDGGVRLVAELGTKPRGLRPGELLRVLGDLPEGRVRRTHQWISSSSARREPLPLAATWTTHAPARAS